MWALLPVIVTFMTLPTRLNFITHACTHAHTHTHTHTHSLTHTLTHTKHMHTLTHTHTHTHTRFSNNHIPENSPLHVSHRTPAPHWTPRAAPASVNKSEPVSMNAAKDIKYQKIQGRKISKDPTHNVKFKLNTHTQFQTPSTGLQHPSFNHSRI